MSDDRVDILLFTTSDMRDARDMVLQRMLDSVGAAIRDSNLRVVCYLLLQHWDGSRETALPEFVRPYGVGKRISLSAARNLLLQAAIANGDLDRARVVAFPDDDAWYSAGTLEGVFAMLGEGNEFDMLVCRYASRPESHDAYWFDTRKRRANARRFVTRASSVTQFLRASLVRKVGFFDERLGVGAPINGGEDLDYALRCYIQCRGRVALYDTPLVGHRDRDTSHRARYFSGSLCAIARSAGEDMGVAAQFLRKLLVGVFLMARRELPPRHFARALRQARLVANSTPLVTHYYGVSWLALPAKGAA